MNDNELLQQILGAVTSLKDDVNDLKLGQKNLESRLDNLETDLTSVKTDLTSVKTDLAETKQDLTSVKTDLTSVKTDLTSVKLTLETKTNRNINLLVEGYQPLNDKVNKIDNDVEILKFDMNVVKAVVTTHSSQLNQLPKAK